MKKSLIILLLALCLPITFAACGEKQNYKSDIDATVFSVTHKKYLGKMSAETDGKGNIVSLVIDELFMPSDWAKVTQESADNAELNTVSANATIYSEYIYVGECLYKGVVTDGTINYFEVLENNALAEKSLESKLLGDNCEQALAKNIITLVVLGKTRRLIIAKWLLLKRAVIR